MTKLLAVFLIVPFSLISCGGGQPLDDDRRRGPRPSGQRSPLQPEGPLSTEEEPDLSETGDPSSEPPDERLPIVIDADNHETIVLSNADDKGYKVHIKVSTKSSVVDVFPKGAPVSIKAPFDGEASLKLTDNTYKLSVSSSTEDKTFHFELHKGRSAISFDEASKTVKKGEKLAETKKPIIFYMTENEELVTLCMTIKAIPNIDLKNNFSSKDPDCSQ